MIYKKLLAIVWMLIAFTGNTQILRLKDVMNIPSVSTPQIIFQKGDTGIAFVNGNGSQLVVQYTSDSVIWKKPIGTSILDAKANDDWIVVMTADSIVTMNTNSLSSSIFNRVMGELQCTFLTDSIVIRIAYAEYVFRNAAGYTMPHIFMGFGFVYTHPTKPEYFARLMDGELYFRRGNAGYLMENLIPSIDRVGVTTITHHGDYYYLYMRDGSFYEVNFDPITIRWYPNHSVGSTVPGNRPRSMRENNKLFHSWKNTFELYPDTTQTTTIQHSGPSALAYTIVGDYVIGITSYLMGNSVISRYDKNLVLIDTIQTTEKLWNVETVSDDTFVVSGMEMFGKSTITYYKIGKRVTNTEKLFPELGKKKVLVYPNPTTGLVNLNCECDEIDQIDLIDMQGHKTTMPVYNNQIDLSALPSGCYILKIDGSLTKILKEGKTFYSFKKPLVIYQRFFFFIISIPRCLGWEENV